jgi:hypothetical protein
MRGSARTAAVTSDIECSAVPGTAPVTPRVCVFRPLADVGHGLERLGARRVSGWALQSQSPRAPVISAIDPPACRREA